MLIPLSLGVGTTAGGIAALAIVTRDRKDKKVTASPNSFQRWAAQIENKMSKDYNVTPYAMLAGVILFAVGVFIFKNPVPAFVLGILAMILPGQVYHKRRERKREKIQEQLSRAVRIFVSEFSVTPQIERGLASVARSVENPVGGIFYRAYTRITYRHNLDDVLRDMAVELDTPHGHMLVQLLRASKKYGKTITPLYHELISKITTAQELHKKSKGEMSGERVLSFIMAMSPLPVYLILSSWTPETQVFLTQTILGRFVVTACFASAVVWLVMDRLMGGRWQ